MKMRLAVAATQLAAFLASCASQGPGSGLTGPPAPQAARNRVRPGRKRLPILRP